MTAVQGFQELWGGFSIPQLLADLLFAQRGGAVDFAIKLVVIGWYAEIFPKLGAWNQNGCAFGTYPVRCIRLWVVDGYLGLKRAITHPPPALRYPHL